MIQTGNCYEVLQNIRYAINEHSDDLVKGLDVTGAFQNSYLVGMINKAQRFIFGLLFNQFPDLFLKRESLVFTDSVAVLPVDCYKIQSILDAAYSPIVPIGINERQSIPGSGSRYKYYRYGNNIQVEKDAISESGTIWYYSRCRDLTMGLSTAGGVKSLTLATSARAQADYYNGMKIENVSKDWLDLITDYEADRECILEVETGDAEEYYGLVPELPEDFHGLIEERAIIEVKQHPKAPFKVTAEDIEIFNGNFRSVMIGFAGTNTGDINIDALINDFTPY